MYIFFFCEGHLRSCGAAQARQEEKIFPLLLLFLHYFLHIKQLTVIKNKQEDDEKDENAAFLRKKERWRKTLGISYSIRSRLCRSLFPAD
jgi:hypothetical protein